MRDLFVFVRNQLLCCSWLREFVDILKQCTVLSIGETDYRVAQEFQQIYITLDICC